jgi:hypothetical protein
LKNRNLQPATIGPFTGGINRSIAREHLPPTDLFQGTGVYMPSAGSLTGCYERDFYQGTSPTAATAFDVFPDAAATLAASRHVPLRVIYWPDDGKLWQLYSKNAAGTTSIRRQGTDREYGTYGATACVYLGYLILCGANQQALAIHSDYSANRAATITAATYTSATGVVSAVTFGAKAFANLIVGDIWELANGSRYAITAVGAATFTVASGLGTITTAGSVVERFRPIRLGSVYDNGQGVGTIPADVALTAGSKSVTVSDTGDWTGTAGMTAGQYITFSQNRPSWSRVAMHNRSYKIASIDSATTLTLEDAFEGAYTGTLYTCRVATTALEIALPCVYKEVLHAAGADSDFSGTGQGNENVMYNAGWDGTSYVSDINDFMYWNLDGTSQPMGLNFGAIQRLVPLENRMIIGLQNGIMDASGTPPIVPTTTTMLSLRTISDGLGFTTYDSVCVGPDFQTIYFGSPDGTFRIFSTDVESIDNDIRNHELYTKSHQYAAFYNGCIYFTDATDDFTRTGLTPASSTLYAIRAAHTERRQYAAIWILHLQTGKWTVTQRLGRGTGTGSGGTHANLAYQPLYIPGLHGGICNPYRGDLTETESLLIGALRVRADDDGDAGFVLLNFASTGAVQSMDSSSVLSRTIVDQNWATDGVAPYLSEIGPSFTSADANVTVTTNVIYPTFLSNGFYYGLALALIGDSPTTIIETTLAVAPSGTSYCELWINDAGGPVTGTGYRIGPTANVQLYSVVAGTPTVIDTVAYTPRNGDVLQVHRTSTTIALYINGTLVQSSTGLDPIGDAEVRVYMVSATVSTNVGFGPVTVFANAGVLSTYHHAQEIIPGGQLVPGGQKKRPRQLAVYGQASRTTDLNPSLMSPAVSQESSDYGETMSRNLVSYPAPTRNRQGERILANVNGGAGNQALTVALGTTGDVQLLGPASGSLLGTSSALTENIDYLSVFVCPTFSDENSRIFTTQKLHIIAKVTANYSNRKPRMRLYDSARAVLATGYLAPLTASDGDSVISYTTPNTWMMYTAWLDSEITLVAGDTYYIGIDSVDGTGTPAGALTVMTCDSGTSYTLSGTTLTPLATGGMAVSASHQVGGINCMPSIATVDVDYLILGDR